MKKIILKIALVIPILLLATGLSAQSIQWSAGANMPDSRRNHSVVALDGKLYLAGGYLYPNKGAVNMFDAFDVSTGKWESKKSMNFARSNFGLNVLAGKIYAIGGDSYSRSCEVFDPSNESWSNCADMPTGRQNLVTASVNNKLYAISGSNQWNSMTNKNEVYDPNTDKWVEKEPIPTPRVYASCAVVGNKIYVIGGIDSPLDRQINKVEVYDTETDSWEELAPMPVKRFGMSVAVVENRIYLIGGDYTAEKSVYIFDPKSNSWTEGNDMKTGRLHSAACNINNKIYVVGGCNNSLVPTNSMEIAAVPLLSVVEAINNTIFEVGTTGKNISMNIHTLEPGYCSISLYDYQGKLVEELIPGIYCESAIQFTQEVNVPAGVYFVVLNKSGRISTKKISLNYL